MKITSNLLDAMPVVSTSPLSSGKSEPEKIAVPDPVHAVKDCTINQSHSLDDLILKHAKPYAEHHGFEIAKNLQDALQRRSKGERVLTFREADIAARAGMNLKSTLVLAGLTDGLNYLVEGIPGVPENPFELRARYNRGIQYKKEKFEKDTPEKQQAALRIMKKLIHQLAQASLPLWPEELTEGFSDHLCFPEYMTYDQYMRARMQTRLLYQTSGEVLAESEEQSEEHKESVA